GVRLFHRSTRSITLTAEGAGFLERCRRILAELEAAERDLGQAALVPSGRLRISLPRAAGLVMPVLAEFMQRYPAIELDVDISNRLVDVIDEGFDAVVRTGDLQDSRLSSKALGAFRMTLVGTPAYFARAGVPRVPADLAGHACLFHRLSTSGKLERWPLRDFAAEESLPRRMICNTLDALLLVIARDLGIACVPDFMVREQLARGELRAVLDEHVEADGRFWLLWPSSRHALPKLRVFIDHMGERLFAPL
ncbi:LysR substrate-binding domain-containing protein, partial [Pseudomonas sp.]|uniref:LysR substrate-binding domain-containing protein n=1 Tax=Pseudomonas sp. TaxID=306 RepID=UPI0028AB513B